MEHVKFLARLPVQPWLTIDSLPNDSFPTPYMKLLGLVRYTWDLTSINLMPAELPEHFQIDKATEEDGLELRKVFSSSFVLDPFWTPAVHEVTKTVDAWLDYAFASDLSTCLALRHGPRIIGASVVLLDPEADNHLAPGPSISMEYRNRGFGTHLFERSLQALQNAGLVRASGIARENAPVSRFLYSRFGGISEPADQLPPLAA